MSMQDGIKAVQQAFNNAAASVRWPMYVRQARQFLRSAVEGFDERKYGFASVVDLLRAAGKEGVLRIERDRQGAVRVFPGAISRPRAAPMDGLPVDIDETVGRRGAGGARGRVAVAIDQPTVEGTVDPVALPEPPMSAADLDECRWTATERSTTTARSPATSCTRRPAVRARPRPRQPTQPRAPGAARRRSRAARAPRRPARAAARRRPRRRLRPAALYGSGYRVST